MLQHTHRRQKILVVDDDPFQRETLSRFLGAAGMEVRTAEDACAMDELLMSERVDLITLDVQMPGEDGLAACRRIRHLGNQTPIIMVTGQTTESDRIVGLELGADDYLPKPLNLRELQARISAVLRRVPAPQYTLAPRAQAPVSFGPFELYLASGPLMRKGGAPVRLTRRELALLKALAAHPRQVMSRDALSCQTRGRPLEGMDRSLDVLVARLRKIVEPYPESPRYIQTVWGQGYVFVPEG